jgi:hypothetical protein
MAKRRRVVRPRIVRPSGAGLRIFTLVVVLVALAAAFAAGAFVGYSESAALSAQIRGLEQTSAELEERILELRQQNAVLERGQQIDREANRTARDQLRESQERRLDLEKEISFLRRLIREGGGGILQVKDFSLEQTAEREFAYRFTVTQLVPDFGWSEGVVEIRLTGTEGEDERTLTLAQLEGSEPAEHRMRFRNFQNFEGQLKLPEALDAHSLVVEVKPKTDNLIPATETFPWPGSE